MAGCPDSCRCCPDAPPLQTEPFAAMPNFKLIWRARDTHLHDRHRKLTQGCEIGESLAQMPFAAGTHEVRDPAGRSCRRDFISKW